MANPLAILSALGPSIIGQNQIGPAAPAFNPQGGGGFLDRLSTDPDEVSGLMAALAQQQNFAPPAVTDPIAQLVGSPGARQFAAGPQDTTTDEQSPAAPLPGPPAAENDPIARPRGLGGLLGGAFENLDENLQSPSKVLGLGLLSQIDPRLAQGGLLAAALFGKNRLFGG